MSLDLDSPVTIRCRECECQFTPAEIRDHMAYWQKALDWIDTAPKENPNESGTPES